MSPCSSRPLSHLLLNSTPSEDGAIRLHHVLSSVLPSPTDTPSCPTAPGGLSSGFAASVCIVVMHQAHDGHPSLCGS